MRTNVKAVRVNRAIGTFMIAILLTVALYGCVPQNTAPTPDISAMAAQMLSTLVALTAQVPTITPSPTVVTPTAAPIIVELQSYNVMTDVNGQVMFSGYIANVSDAAIKGVQFKLRLFDQSGNEVAAKDELVCFIEPGGKRPFLSLMGYSPLEWSGAGIEFGQPVLASSELTELARSVQLENVTLNEMGAGYGELQGTIKNIGQSTLPFVFIGGAIYDQNGNVIKLLPLGAGAVYGQNSLTLMPGESTSWIVSMDTPNPAQAGTTFGAFVSNIPLPSDSNPCQ